MKLIVLLFSVMSCGLAHAQKLELSEIKAPSDLENIHVINIASDGNSSEFLIFVKKAVPLHKHVTHSESVYILEGKGVFQLGGKTFDVGPGDYIKIPEGVPHSLKVLSEIPLKAISVQAPEFFGKDRVMIE